MDFILMPWKTVLMQEIEASFDMALNTLLTRLPMDKMAAISQTIFADTFLSMKGFIFWLRLH